MSAQKTPIMLKLVFLALKLSAMPTQMLVMRMDYQRDQLRNHQRDHNAKISVDKAMRILKLVLTALKVGALPTRKIVLLSLRTMLTKSPRNAQVPLKDAMLMLMTRKLAQWLDNAKLLLLQLMLKLHLKLKLHLQLKLLLSKVQDQTVLSNANQKKLKNALAVMPLGVVIIRQNVLDGLRKTMGL